MLLRAGAGLATAIYDPAARGYLTDATPPERRGEAFGLYGAAQMGGLLLGPAIGAIGAASLGGIGFVFVFSGVAALLAALPLIAKARGRGESHERDAPGARPRRHRIPARRTIHEGPRGQGSLRGRRHPPGHEARRRGSSTAVWSRS